KLLVHLLDRPEASTGTLPQMMFDLAAIVGARQDLAEVAACLTALRNPPPRPGGPDPLRVLAALADGMARRGKSLNDFLTKLPDEQRDLRDWVGENFRAAATIAADPRAPGPARLAAIRLLASASWEAAGPALAGLLGEGS